MSSRIPFSCLFELPNSERSFGNEAHTTERQQGLEWVKNAALKPTDRVLVLPKTSDYLAQVHLWALVSSSVGNYILLPFLSSPTLFPTLIDLSGYSRATTGIARSGKRRSVTGEDSRAPNEPLDEKFTCCWENSMQLKVCSLRSCSEVLKKVFRFFFFFFDGWEMYVIIKNLKKKHGSNTVYFAALCKNKTFKFWGVRFW